MPLEEISYRFKVHPMNDETETKSDKIRDAIINVADIIDIYCADSREKSIALTKLEECLFWCNASLARNQ